MTDPTSNAANDSASFLYPLSDKQIELIAEKAAQRAVTKLTEEFYKQVGKSVVNKFLIVLGAAALAGSIWVKQIKGGG